MGRRIQRGRFLLNPPRATTSSFLPMGNLKQPQQRHTLCNYNIPLKRSRLRWSIEKSSCTCDLERAFSFGRDLTKYRVLEYILMLVLHLALEGRGWLALASRQVYKGSACRGQSQQIDDHALSRLSRKIGFFFNKIKYGLITPIAYVRTSNDARQQSSHQPNYRVHSSEGIITAVLLLGLISYISYRIVVDGGGSLSLYGHAQNDNGGVEKTPSRL